MNNLKPFLVLLILLFISVGFNWYQYKHPREVDIIGKTITLPGKHTTTIITLPAGNQAAVAKNIQVYKEKSAEAEVLLNSIPPLVAEKDVTSIVAVDSKLQLELDATKLAVNDKEKEIKIWKDKYNSITIDNANNTAKSTSDVSPKIINAEKREKFYQPKVPYTTVTSENPSILFNGVQSFTFKNPKQKDFLEINAKIQAIYIKPYLVPSVGLELVFNPDGKMLWFGGYNYYYDTISNKFVQFISRAGKYNLVRY